MATRPRRTTKNWSAASPSWQRYSPAARRMFVAQPATSANVGASSPSKKGWSGRYCSIVRMSFLSGADGGDLCREIDGGRAPGDAATAADASRRAELVHPRCELVCGPLAVARLHRVPDAAAVEVGEVGSEAGVPHPPPLRRAAGEVADDVDRGAEARGADQRAVRAGQAATRHVGPPRVLGVRVQQVAQTVRVERPPHVLRRRSADLLGAEMVLFARRQDLDAPRAGLQVVEDLLAAVAARDYEEAVRVLVEQLGQREVETLIGDRAGAHRDTEARASRVGAGQRHDERGLAPCDVCRVGHLPLRQDAVVDRECMQVAGPNAEQRQALRVDDSGCHLLVGADPSTAPQQLARGEQQRLPRLRTRGEGEQRLVVALAQPVAAGVLEISHAARKLIDRLDLGVDDGAVVHAEIESVDQLPRGVGDLQDAGSYRLRERDDETLFAFAAGPQAWKSLLFPSRELLWSGRRVGAEKEVTAAVVDAKRLALFGVRSCDLHALAIHDRVLAKREVTDTAYVARREATFIVALTCSDPGGTCFCVSMGTGPVPDEGFDLALTELLDQDGHRFLVVPGSGRGQEVLDDLKSRAGAGEVLAAGEQDHLAAQEVGAAAAQHMGRTLDTNGLRDLLYAHPC